MQTGATISKTAAPSVEKIESLSKKNNNWYRIPRNSMFTILTYEK